MVAVNSSIEYGISRLAPCEPELRERLYRFWDTIAALPVSGHRVP